MPSTIDLLAGLVVTGLFLAIVATAEAWRRWRAPDPEWTRKLIHIAGGCVALSLPFVISSHWVVLAMATGMATLFGVGKFTGHLQSLHGVARKSSGTEYYPAVIYLLFVLTPGEPWKYFICVLVLTTADALAALVGGRYGRLRYQVDENFKSLEGSLAFLTATFLAVFVPLAIWPIDQGPGLTISFLTALMVAMLTTAFEAVSQHGRDNLWVPLGTLITLNRVLFLPPEELSKRLAVLATYFLIIGLAAWSTSTFNVGSTLILVLAAYASWTLGSIDWALPALLGVVFYLSVFFLQPKYRMIASRPVCLALIIPFLVMIVASVLAWSGSATGYRFWYGPFLAGCIAVTAKHTWDKSSLDQQASWRLKWMGAAITTCIALAFIMAPTAWLHREVSLQAPLCLAIVVLAVAIPAGVISDHPKLTDSGLRWWAVRLLSISLAVGSVAALQLLGVSPLWNPR